jgi:hypothetical protein
MVGVCVEVYTFFKTNDIQKSTGLGWSTLAVIFMW